MESFSASTGLTLFLCGDVMTGRGIDQILPHPVDPHLYESFVKDARDYVMMAEKRNGKLLKPVSYTYVWGDAMQVWAELKPDLKIINLETSITVNPDPWPEKVVQYRMHPNNINVLTAAGVNVCTLANNHTLDWGREGLLETMKSLQGAKLTYAGAGHDKTEAAVPAVLETSNGRVIILAYGSRSSGIPKEWGATLQQAGINMLPELHKDAIPEIAAQIKQLKTKGDVVVFSVHWGSNWGYDIPPTQRDFAHQLIDTAGVDLVFGHSSHHPKGIEIYQEKLIVYGAGDFINDYEGISGHELYRGDLALMYFPQLEPGTGRLRSLRMIPMQRRNFRLHLASPEDAGWLTKLMNRESLNLGSGIVLQDNSLLLKCN